MNRAQHAKLEGVMEVIITNDNTLNTEYSQSA